VYLRNLVIRLGLASMNDVRELHRILNEEDGNVVSNDIPVTFIGIEFHSEASNVANGIRGPTAAEHSGKAQEDWGFTRGVGQDTCTGDI
jgi:hypothetical protein